eukprot:scaffold1954_cov268-Pinguiococcus_pyrenoidosus.AAC.243
MRRSREKARNATPPRWAGDSLARTRPVAASQTQICGLSPQVPVAQTRASAVKARQVTSPAWRRHGIEDDTGLAAGEDGSPVAVEAHGAAEVTQPTAEDVEQLRGDAGLLDVIVSQGLRRLHEGPVPRLNVCSGVEGGVQHGSRQARRLLAGISLTKRVVEGLELHRLFRGGGGVALEAVYGADAVVTDAYRKGRIR